MTIGLPSSPPHRTGLFISPFLTDSASGGGLVSRMNLACLQGSLHEVKAIALSNVSSGQGFTAIGSPGTTLTTALCNLLLMAGRLTPSALYKVARALRTTKPDVVFLDSSSLGWIALLTRLLAPKARLIAFFHNIEFDFQLERSRAEGRKYLLSAWAEYVNERLTTRLADVVLMLTKEDSERAAHLYRRGADALTPVCLSDDADNQDTWPDEAGEVGSADGVLFVGSGFFANREAVDFLLKQLAPALKKQGNTRIRIAGSGFTAAEWKEDIPDNVDMLGRVPDLTPYYRKAIAFVAPIFSGAGMKVKVAEALKHGLPVIGTPLALRGYRDDIPDAQHLLTASSIDEFVYAIQICSSSSLSRSVLARLDFEARFSFAAGQRRMRSILEQSFEDIR